LIISIDGTSQDTYEQYRVGGNWRKYLKEQRILSNGKGIESSTPHIVFQFLVVKPNEHQIEEVQQLAKDLGVDEITDCP